MAISDKTPSFGTEKPFIFSDDDPVTAAHKLEELVNGILDGHEEVNAEGRTPEGRLASARVNVPVLIVDDKYREAYELLPFLVHRINEVAINRGYVIFSLAPTVHNLLDHLEDGTITQDNRGSYRAIGMTFTLVNWDRYLADHAAERDEDGDPHGHYWWNRSFSDALEARVKRSLGALAELIA